MITVTIHRSELERAGACADGLALYDAIAAMQPETDARRGKRLKVRWTPLHRVWLSAAYPSFWWWLYERGLVAESDLRWANLRGANLGGANLCGANLRGANLGGANLCGADLRLANLRGANLRWANLGGADLGGANLRGADLRGANLRGANLGGANLRGADLGDFELDPASGLARRKS